MVRTAFGEIPEVQVMLHAAEQAVYDPAPCPPGLELRAAGAVRRLARRLPPKRRQDIHAAAGAERRGPR